ncbi:UPF0182 family protein [Nocardioides sp. Root151]|uniref:UPF0182 family membrane protein n=1 Tax=Nocardioides sp. Root151 TaxID=1736475 RepID=UPI0007034DD0|nr:UPF0182 family protein [Nocardioides sp. Root151]KQZ74967.1 hypothetical protein ASD66_00870 [Nocardioides sp. Root151]
MSDMYDDGDEETRTEEPRRPSRARALWITLAVVIALFLAFTGFTAFWTERLWFSSTGYSSVFTTLVRTRIGLFLVFGLVMALAVGINLGAAFRYRPIFRPASPEQVSLDRYREAINPIRVLLLVGVSLAIGAFAGATASGKWREYMLWRNGGSFGKEDPYFHKDIGFYIFDLPWLHFVVDFTMAVLVVTLLGAAVVHYLYGGIRLQSAQDRFSGPAAAQLSLLLGLFVLVKGLDYYLDRFDLLNESGSLMTGIGYADDHAVLPAKNILMFIALICAVLFFANVVRRTWLLPTVGISLLALSAILLGLIWPGIVQQFQVSPSQAQKEEPYIQKNIDATRAAYDLEDVAVEDFKGETDLSPAQQAAELANTKEIRLLDPALVRATFEQLQQEKGYYTVADVLDVDRYKIGGQTRDVVIGVRELNQDGLPDDAKNWSNLHTVYTHGYGVIAAFGNQRGIDNDTQSTGDKPEWVEQSLPPTGELSKMAPGGYRGAIYYGEKSPEYSIVGKAGDDSEDVELNLPDDSETGGARNTYDGKGGVKVNNTFRKVMYAWKFGEPNIVLSGRVNKNSKILYDRDPRKMVEKVAPWLTVDADPFPAVVDGKVVWLLDGYTTTDQYPQSERGSFEDMTSDSLDDGNEFRTLPTDEINYMRNAVKAVVDAYDGSVTLYAWDEEDPLLEAWRKAFPGTVKDRDEIPADLLEHMRYPEDLFKVQRYQLGAYHVEDADTFYEGKARWVVPEDPNSQGNLQPPYRLSVRTPGRGADPTFSLTSAYVPNGRQNLAAFVSVGSDASLDSYGKIQVLELPSGKAVDGPGLAANRFGSNDEIQRQLEALTRNSNVRILNGNLLTLPVGESLLYVQPVYAVRQGTSTANYPVLRQVLVSFGEKTAIGQTVAEAVAKVLDVELDADPTPGTGDPGQPTGTVDEQIRELLTDADQEFKDANAALADGNLQKYAAATKRAEELVAEALELSDQSASEQEQKTEKKADE